MSKLIIYKIVSQNHSNEIMNDYAIMLSTWINKLLSREDSKPKF